MIKTDPSQTKAVVVLLLVLGGAVVATVLRIHPNSARPAVAVAAAAATTRESAAPRVTVTAGPSSRNPFRKPEAVRAAFSREAKSGAGSGAVPVQEGGLSPAGVRLPSMSAVPSPSADKSPDAQSDTQTNNSEAPDLGFELLATVAGPHGITAVISINASKTRVVTVGDVLDGDYKVVRLDQHRAFVANGRYGFVLNKAL